MPVGRLKCGLTLGEKFGCYAHHRFTFTPRCKTIWLFSRQDWFKILSRLDWFGFNVCLWQKSVSEKSPLEIVGKASTRETETVVYSGQRVLYCGEIVLFWWDCIVVADNWSNNPGHSGLALSGCRSLYYWIPALFCALLTSAYCCSTSHTIHAQRSRQPMSISWVLFPSNVWSKSSAAELQPYLEELNHIYWFSISSSVLTFPEGQ